MAAAESIPFRPHQRHPGARHRDPSLIQDRLRRLGTSPQSCIPGQAKREPQPLPLSDSSPTRTQLRRFPTPALQPVGRVERSETRHAPRADHRSFLAPREARPASRSAGGTPARPPVFLGTRDRSLDVNARSTSAPPPSHAFPAKQSASRDLYPSPISLRPARRCGAWYVSPPRSDPWGQASHAPPPRRPHAGAAHHRRDGTARTPSWRR